MHRARASIINWIQIGDEAFFDGESVLLVYYDEFGRTCYTRRQGPNADEKRGFGVPALQHAEWSAARGPNRWILNGLGKAWESHIRKMQNLEEVA